MLVPYKVLLPQWVFEHVETDQEVLTNTIQYIQRYPHYTVNRIENGFAICERINSTGEDENG